MNGIVIGLLVWQAIQGVLIVAYIGQERPPITPASALFTIAVLFVQGMAIVAAAS